MHRWADAVAHLALNKPCDHVTFDVGWSFLGEVATGLVSVGERVVDTPLLEFIEELLTASESTRRGPDGVSGTR